MEKRGSQCAEIVGTHDKRQITAVFCGTMLGEFLPPQLIYKEKTSHCHPKFNFPSDWDIAYAPKHWSMEQTMIQYIQNIVTPNVKRVEFDLGNEKVGLVIMDNFKGITTKTVLNHLESNNILVALLPPNTTIIYP